MQQIVSALKEALWDPVKKVNARRTLLAESRTVNNRSPTWTLELHEGA